MKKKILSLLIAPFIYSASSRIRINEIVTNPQQDHNASGSVTDTDEYLELFNYSGQPNSLQGWRLELIDTTPESISLSNIIINPGEFYVVQNPRGEQNNNGRVELYDSLSNLVDSVSYGTWLGATVTNANATGLFNESLSRYPDGSTNWVKTYASRGRTNFPSPEERTMLYIFREQDGNKVGIEVIGASQRESVLQTINSLSDTNWTDIYTNRMPFRFTNDSFSQRFYRTREEYLR